MRTTNLRRLLAVVVGAVVVVPAAPGAASAAITAAVSAAFTHAAPEGSLSASRVVYCGGPGQPRCGGDFVRVSWGAPFDAGGQNRLDFLPAPAGVDHEPGEPFVLGDLHFANTQIHAGSGIRSVRLNLSVAVTDEARGTAFTAAVTLPLQIDTTPNNGPGCPYNPSPPCADAILLPPDVPVRYDVGGASYQVDVLGLGNAQTPSGLSSRLVAPEDTEVVAPLMARVTRDVGLDADAGPDQAVDEGTPVTLDGTGSQGDGLVHAWRQVSGPEVTLDDPAAPRPTFTAPRVTREESLEFELTVWEAADPAVTDTDSVLLAVRDVNEPPVLALPDDLVVPATGPQGAVVTYDVTASDPDGQETTVVCSPPSGTAFAVGTTRVRCTASDGLAEVTGTFDVLVNAPPQLQLPGQVTVDATSPAGAPATYEASATDDGRPIDLACEPASGTTFPIGTTTVECTAVDEHDAVTTGSFDITVRGAPAQLADLEADVTGVGPGTSLVAKVRTASSAVSAGRTPAACSALQDFLDEVRAQSGKHVPADTAAVLLADATRIRTVLACR